MTPPLSPLLAALLILAGKGRTRSLPLAPEAYYILSGHAPRPLALLAALLVPLALSASARARATIHALLIIELAAAPPWLALASYPPLLLAAAGLDRDRTGRIILALTIVILTILPELVANFAFV